MVEIKGGVKVCSEVARLLRLAIRHKMKINKESGGEGMLRKEQVMVFRNLAKYDESVCGLRDKLN